MKTLKFTAIASTAVLACTLGLGFSLTAHAQDKMGDMKMMQTNKSADMADGEIRRIDKDSKKITLKHGEIKNLEMPGMTMVFQVKDPAMLDKVKVGDKVKFTAEQINGAIVVTDIQPRK